MKKIIFAITCGLALSASAAMAGEHDFNINNNTDSYGTIKIGFYPCSSMMGSSGIIKPHSVHVFTHSTIKMICGKSCNANFYPSNNCTGKIIGTAKLDPQEGVLSFTNNDEEHYQVEGSGFDFTINEIKNSFRDFLQRLF